MSARARFLTADEAVALIPDGATVGLIGGGGGLCEASLLHERCEARFLETGHPRGLTLLHSLGIGDRNRTGLNRFAHEGMTRRVIGGHWVWSPRMQQLAAENRIESYVLPGGVAMQLLREIAAGRPGLFTHVGLGTFCDPRLEGGRMNAAAREPIVELAEIDGVEYLRYLPFPIHACLLKGSVADEDGNISLDEEPANLDTAAMAMAVRNSGGVVIVQVREKVPAGSLGARQVRIPAAMVDAIVVDPDQRQSYDIAHDPTLSGQAHRPEPRPPLPALSVRQVIARRARRELQPGAVVNHGFGIPDEIATLVAAEEVQGEFHQTIEHGTYGGTLLTGTMFGYARNPSCMIDGPSQFDFYAGGGLDIAFLGFGEFDGHGDVNASKLGGLPVGPGGFIDIAQNARKVVFCGTFDARGAQVEPGNGRLEILGHGSVRKLVDKVAQVTFSGEQALKRGQEVLYVTERAVFALRADGVHLIEIAPGVDLRADVLERIGFAPKVGDVRQMDRQLFEA